MSTRFRRIILIISFAFFSINQVSSQNFVNKDQLYFEGYYHYGFILPHHDYIGYFVNEHVKGFQLNMGLFSIGNKYWHKNYNYPRMGIGYYHSGLGNKKVFGLLDAFYAYVDRPFLSINNRVNFGNRLSFGLGHISEKFDLHDNNYNIAIGSTINVFIQYNLEGSVRITPKTQMKAGVCFIHSSNGAIKEPNKGLNMVNSFIGLQYSFNDQRGLILKTHPTDPDTSKSQIVTTFSYGRKSTSRFNTFEYPVYELSLEYSRRISTTGWIGVSISGYYDRSIKKLFEDQTVPDTTFKTSDYYFITLNPSYEMRMGRVSFLFQPGLYLKYGYKDYSLITNRVGLRYNFDNNLVASVSIRAHWLAQADFIEWGIGYKWKR